MKTLTARLTELLPEAEAYLLERSGSLVSIKEEIMDLVGDALTNISRVSAEVHPALRERMAQKWEPGFKGALKVPGEYLDSIHALQNNEDIYICR
jgi:hypothetical protein